MTPLTEHSLEKYLKKLAGRTDIEDAMKRLDKLTQEEARMAIAQNLKATYTVDERVKGAVDKVLDVGAQVKGVDARVLEVDARVASVGDGVKAINDQVAVVINGAQIIFGQSTNLIDSNAQMGVQRGQSSNKWPVIWTK
jgi:hypothetical protein